MEAFIIAVKGNIKGKYAVPLEGVSTYESFKVRVEATLYELKKRNPEATFKVAAIFSLDA
jgi:hypothetical protein